MGKLESMIGVSLLVPMGDPSKEGCIMGLPLLLWGDPGIGKTARIGAVTKSLQMPMETTIPATCAPEDFSGVPFIKDGKLVVECTLGAVRRLVEEGKGVWYLDEISCAVPAVQSVLLRAVHERVIGDTVLPSEVRVLAAANPVSSAAGGWELEPPMANRFAHIDVAKPNNHEWISWLLDDVEVEDDIEIHQAEVLENWAQAFSKAKSIMAGFMKVKGVLHGLPAMGSKDRGRAWPSPRTWEMATRSVATCYALNKKDLALSFVAACVGEGQAIEWNTWLASADLPDPKTMCTHGWTPDKKRLDRTVAALSSMTGYIVAQKKEEDQIALSIGAWKVLKATEEAGMLDLAVMSAKTLSKRNLDSNSPNKELVDAAKPLMLRMGKSNIVTLGKSLGAL